MPEELNENLELENNEVLNNEDSKIVEGGSDSPEDLNQVVLDLQTEIMEKDSQIDGLKQQILAFDGIKSDQLFVVPVTADELKNEKLPELLQKLQEYVYFENKSSFKSPVVGAIEYSQVNEQKRDELKTEINSMLKQLGRLGLK